MGVFGDFLDTVGGVLSAPRNLLYQHVLSPLLGGDVGGFGDILTKKFGMDPDNVAPPALGFMGDIGTDPLTYLGGFGASALRNKLLGETAALGSAAGRGMGLAVAPGIKGVAETTPVVWGARLERAAEGARPGLSALETRPGFSLASRVGPEGEVLLGEVSPGTAQLGRKTLVDQADSVRDLSLGLGGTPEGGLPFRGVYNKASGSIYSTLDRPALDAAGRLAPGAEEALALRRHELVHSLVDRARTDEALRSQLGFLPRTAAKLSASESPFARGLGVITDEMGAHAAESRNLLGQARNAGALLFNPQTNRQYQRLVAAESPLAAALYGMLPGTFPAAGATAGYGLSALGQ